MRFLPPSTILVHTPLPSFLSHTNSIHTEQNIFFNHPQNNDREYHTSINQVHQLTTRQDSATMSPILLLIFKEYAGKYHLLNAPGLPVKTVTSLINSSNTSPFVDTMLLMSVTDVLTDARFSG